MLDGSAPFFAMNCMKNARYLAADKLQPAAGQLWPRRNNVLFKHKQPLIADSDLTDFWNITFGGGQADPGKEKVVFRLSFWLQFSSYHVNNGQV